MRTLPTTTQALLSCLFFLLIMLPDDWLVSRLMHRQTPKLPTSSAMKSYKQPLNEKTHDEQLTFIRVDKGVDVEVACRRPVYETRASRLTRFARLFLCAILLCAAFLSLPVPSFNSVSHLTGFQLPSGEILTTGQDACKQSSLISPVAHAGLLEDLEVEFASSEFRLKAYESLGGAVRVPYVSPCLIHRVLIMIILDRTVMYDDLLPPGQDDRWDIFADFHAYLEQRFPLV